MDLASYYVIIATAGHDTTSSTMAGGLHALLRHPDELARLQADLDLLPTAVEEMIRWVTPVKEFMRTAAQDAVVGGTEIAAGQSLYLAYLSANRDEAVFEDPFRFDVGPPAEQARGVRLRTALLPRGAVGPDGDPGDLRRAVAEVGVDRAGGHTDLLGDRVRRRPQDAADPLPRARVVPPEGLSRIAYYEAGLELLAEGGHGGLTIAALCERLSVTKGSFYHHFGDMAEYVSLLLDHWEAEHATRLIALSESVTDPEERFDLLEGIAVGLPHGAEAAIRAWSWNSEVVAAAQERVDRARLGPPHPSRRRCRPRSGTGETHGQDLTQRAGRNAAPGAAGPQEVDGGGLRRAAALGGRRGPGHARCEGAGVASLRASVSLRLSIHHGRCRCGRSHRSGGRGGGF